MKKLLVILLALFVLAESGVSCCPSDDCQDDSTASSNEGSKETGACSPFLTCGTCAGFVQMTKAVTLSFPPLERPTHHEKLDAFSLSTYYSSFFQPPRSSRIHSA